MKFGYIHGFNSKPDHRSEKFLSLSSLGEVTMPEYDSFLDFDSIVDGLSKSFNDDSHEYVFVGTSLGAYYAAKLGELYSRPSVLINPAMDPKFFFRRALNKNTYAFNNKRLDKNAIESYSNTINDFISKTKYRPLLLLDESDEVFNSKFSANRMRSFCYDVKMFAYGNHRFAHMPDSVKYIKEYVNACECVCECF